MNDIVPGHGPLRGTTDMMRRLRAYFREKDVEKGTRETERRFQDSSEGRRRRNKERK